MGPALDGTVADLLALNLNGYIHQVTYDSTSFWVGATSINRSNSGVKRGHQGFDSKLNIPIEIIFFEWVHGFEARLGNFSSLRDEIRYEIHQYCSPKTGLLQRPQVQGDKLGKYRGNMRINWVNILGKLG